MGTPQSSVVLAALDRAVDQFPNLTVIDAGDCEGRAWVTDPSTSTVYVRSSEACTWSANLLEALDDLVIRTGAEDETVYPPLRMIHGGGEADQFTTARTGTHNN